MGISKRLHTLLKNKNISISKFSELTGIPYRTLQNYLGGTRSPTTENLIILCTRMGINFNWLLTGQGDMYLNSLDPTPTNDPTHAEIVQYFKNKTLAKRINWKLINLEKNDPKLLDEIEEFINFKLSQKGINPDEELVRQPPCSRRKNGTSGSYMAGQPTPAAGQTGDKPNGRDTTGGRPPNKCLSPIWRAIGCLAVMPRALSLR